MSKLVKKLNLMNKTKDNLFKNWLVRRTLTTVLIFIARLLTQSFFIEHAIYFLLQLRQDLTFLECITNSKQILINEYFEYELRNRWQTRWQNQFISQRLVSEASIFIVYQILKIYRILSMSYCRIEYYFLLLGNIGFKRQQVRVYSLISKNSE